MLLFVYGTLLRGLSRAGMLRQSRFLGPALARGRLYDLRYYPGLLPGRDWVVGELHEVDPGTLSRIDRVEDCDSRNPAASLYRREEIPVRLFSGPFVTAQCYLFQGEIAGAPVIPHGDYRRYRLELRPPPYPTGAYGSNLSRERIETRIGPVGRRRPGSFPLFGLCFEKRATGGEHRVANLRFTGTGECRGALQYVSPEQLATMDRFENTPEQYLRVVLPFRVSGQRSHRLVQTWVAHPDRIAADLPVSEEYLRHVRTGYAEFGWPADALAAALASPCPGTAPVSGQAGRHGPRRRDSRYPIAD